MNFNEYQNKVREYAVYKNVGNNLGYPVMGLAGEAGELAGKVSKYLWRDKMSRDEIQHEILSEGGDILWFLTRALEEAGLTLEEAAEYNVNVKLKSRAERGVLHGSGDER